MSIGKTVGVPSGPVVLMKYVMPSGENQPS
jgi:hypothetical protein